MNINLSPEKSGSFRARFEFTLSDGRVLQRGPIRVLNSEAADLLGVDLEASVLASIQLSDAFDAVDAGIQTAYKLATVEQVQYAWVKAGYDEDEHYKSYEKLKDIAPSLLALGLTDLEYSQLLNTSSEEATTAREYWEFLDANSATIAAYAGVN